MDDKEQVELIEKYLNGQMAVHERTAFEKRLQSDPVLARKTFSYRESFINHLSAGKYKIKNGIIAVGKKSSSLSKSMADLNFKKNITKVIGLILIMLIGLISFYFFIDKSPDYTALFNQYYNETLSTHPLLTDREVVDTYGITHYQNRDFSRAIPALEKEIIATPGDARLYLYLGLSYLESDVDDKAKLNFEKAESMSDGRYWDSATWYLALTEIKLSQIEEAKQNLTELIRKNDNNPYKDKASRLLEKI